MAGQESEEKSALGVGADGEKEAEESQGGEGSASDQVRQDNRRQRRAAAARRRQRRQRELDEARAVGLDAGEIVDEALVRSSDRVAKWLIRNFRHLQWVFVAAVLFWGGSTAWRFYTASKSANASDQLLAGPEALSGIVLGPEETQIPLGDEKIAKFASAEEQLEASETAYEKARGMLRGSGIEAFAMLGEAAIHIDQAKYAEAKDLYEQVLKLEVGKKQPEIEGRAREGLAMSLEGLGNAEGALEAYRELEQRDIEGFTALAKFEQARLLSQKDAERAFELMESVLNDSASMPAPGPLSAPRYTEQRARELRAALLAVHPELAKKAAHALLPAPPGAVPLMPAPAAPAVPGSEKAAP